MISNENLLSRALNLWGRIAKDNVPGASPEGIDGSINANNQLIESDNGRMIGTLSGDDINGQFQDGDNNTITATGQRTL